MTFFSQRFPDREVGATHEPVELVLTRAGAPMDLSAAVVLFVARDAVTGALVVDHRPASGDATGLCSYIVTGGEVAVAGTLRCQFIATFTDGSVQSSPVMEMRLLPRV